MSDDTSRPAPRRLRRTQSTDSRRSRARPGIPSVTQRPKVTRLAQRPPRGRSARPVARRRLGGLDRSGVLRHRRRTRDIEAHRRPARRSGNRAAPARHDAAAASRRQRGPASGRMIPAIVPLPPRKRAEPIRVRRTEPRRAVAPEDAPVVLVSSRPSRSGSSRRRASQPASAAETDSRRVDRAARQHQAQPRCLSTPAARTARHADEEHRACDQAEPNRHTPLAAPPLRGCKRRRLAPPTPAAASSAASCQAPRRRGSPPERSATAASRCPRGPPSPAP